MDYILNKDSFFVTELFSPELKENGIWKYYFVEKKDLSHKQLLKRLPRDALFCGIKDRNATTAQWFCSKQLIDNIEEENLTVEFRGACNEKVWVGKHKGNSFKVLIELTEKETKKLKTFKEKKEITANYFGEQRFSKKTKEIFEEIEKKNYENALKIFLCEKTKFDTERSTAMKEVVKKNWGNWKTISENELINDTGKKVLFEFLEKNPLMIEDAFLHAEPKSIKHLIKTMQAIRWNDALAREVLLKKPNNIFTQINGQKVPLLTTKAMKREITLEPTPFEKKILKRKLERKTFLLVKHFSLKNIKGNTYWLNFELGKGSYATVFLLYLNEWLKQKAK